MYLLWLALLVVLLVFSFRPVPYLEGMTDKGKEEPKKKPEGYDITLKNPSETSLMAYSDDPKKYGMDNLDEIYAGKKSSYEGFEPKTNHYKIEVEKGPNSNCQQSNAQITVTPERSAYKIETDKGTYAGYNGPNVEAKITPGPPPSLSETNGGYRGPNIQATITPDGYSVTGPKRTYYGSCSSTMYGCCPDSKDPKVDEAGSNCLPAPSAAPTTCAGSSYGCCPDQLTAKVDANGSNCAAYPPCAGSTFGCCPDGKSTKTDYSGSNCVPPPPVPSSSPAPSPSAAPTTCAGSSYGCCPDQLTAKVDANGSNCAAYPSNGMIDTQPIRTPALDSYNTSTVFLSPPRKESTCPEPQPCPPCARCPEPSFECKKVPNYSSANTGHLPVPILSDFSQFGM